MAISASETEINPTTKAEFIFPIFPAKAANPSVSGTTKPLTKLGTVVVTVALILVPNCSEAMVTNNAQYPVAQPKRKHMVLNKKRESLFINK